MTPAIFISSPAVVIAALRFSILPKDATCSCKSFEQVRRRYNFLVVGYVVMPEHFHLLITEPEPGTQSTVMQVLKQRFARRMLRTSAGILDKANCGSGTTSTSGKGAFTISSCSAKRIKIEKLRYIHRNPVKRGLVASPELWRWSSYRFYAFGEPGPVLIDLKKRAEMKVRPVSTTR